MAKRSKPIHLTKICNGFQCKAACDRYFKVTPLEAIIKGYSRPRLSKGTFDPTKVTCKRCLKSGDYKTAVDKVKYPLFFLKDN